MGEPPGSVDPGAGHPPPDSALCAGSAGNAPAAPGENSACNPRNIIRPSQIILLLILAGPAHAQIEEPDLESLILQLTRETEWRLVEAVRVHFDTFHPQGMAFADNAFFLSTVDVTRPTRRFPEPENGLDRTPGAGNGYLIRLGSDGREQARVQIGEGTQYHPGGIDFDGKRVWVPVAEYRPDSRSIIYAVDPSTMEAAEAFRVDDHIGAVVADAEAGRLHGVSWGGRRIYTWDMPDEPRARPVERSNRRNPTHYVDYQDCMHVGGGRAVCTGLAAYAPGPNMARFALGGLELVDFRAGTPVHQVPMALWTDDGRPMTQNPSHFEATPNGLRAYFIPEDNESVIYVFEAHFDDQRRR